MDRIDELKQYISKYNSAIIAFSGGVDSTFLAKVSAEVLGQNVLLVTATSSTYPFYELEEAKLLASELKIKHKVIVSEEIDIPGFADNPPDRCYYCKTELFKKIIFIAKELNYEVVFDGSNKDDENDFRPGKKALKELNIISPLAELNFSKEEIRKYSKLLGLKTAEKPSYACLASRFPYGEKITAEKLERVGKSELKIRNLGFNTFRVRSHGNLARLEFAEQEIEKAWTLRKNLEKICKDEGFVFVCIDTTGYRTGAMNEGLDIDTKNQWKL
jgi:uncharacterized protein